MLDRPNTIDTDIEPSDTHRPAAKASAPSSQEAPAVAPTFYQTMDQSAHAAVAKATSGLAPSVLGEAWMDWAVHMATSPGKQCQLLELAMRNARDIWTQALAVGADENSQEAVSDKRFSGDTSRPTSAP